MIHFKATANFKSYKMINLFVRFKIVLEPENANWKSFHEKQQQEFLCTAKLQGIIP